MLLGRQRSGPGLGRPASWLAAQAAGSRPRRRARRAADQRVERRGRRASGQEADTEERFHDGEHRHAVPFPTPRWTSVNPETSRIALLAPVTKSATKRDRCDGPER